MLGLERQEPHEMLSPNGDGLLIEAAHAIPHSTSMIDSNLSHNTSTPEKGFSAVTESQASPLMTRVQSLAAEQLSPTSSDQQSPLNSDSNVVGCALPPKDPNDHMLHSADYILQHQERFNSFNESTDACLLLYPDGREERFLLVIPSVEREHHPVMDILAVMRVVSIERAELFGGDEFQNALDRAFRRNDPKKVLSSFSLVRELVDRYNRVLRELIDNGKGKYKPLTPMSREMMSHLWRQSYERIVDDPDKLNRYRSFSREVYGETCHPLVIEIMSHLKLNKRSLFVDLGMGIGNVVFQVAAQTQCNVYGIELLSTPFEYAERLMAELRLRVEAHGKKMGNTILRQGDFLNCPELAELFPAVDVVFCQNYAFDAETNNALINLLVTMHNGAQIVSFKPFAPIRTRLREHSINDPTSIFRVTKHTYSRADGVSWMTNPIDYFIHTVDRAYYKRFSEEISKSSHTEHSPKRSRQQSESP